VKRVGMAVLLTFPPCCSAFWLAGSPVPAFEVVTIKPSAPQADSSRLGPHLSPKWYAPPLSGRLLRKAVVGYRAIAAAAGLAKSTLTMILTGEGLRIRRHHADRIRPWIEPPSQTAPSFGRTDGHCSTSCW
jgi:hypothetical protein